MNWKEVMNGVQYTILATGAEADITSITYDSRKAGPGSAFAAVKGTAFDGHDYVAKAAEQGAALAVVEHELPSYPEGMTVLLVESTLEAMPVMAVNFYEKPCESMTMIGVTGTKGKTTTTTLIHRILLASGQKAGLIGTIENRIGEDVYPSQYTTPQAFDLEALLKQMKDENVQAAAMEVSSHALALHRVDGMKFEIGVFTNLSLDHLDFHKTMEAYLQAKIQLFRMCRMGLTNMDSPEGRIVRECGFCRMRGYAVDTETDYQAVNLKMDVHGIHYDLKKPDGTSFPVSYPVPGRFNVYNTLAAAAVCLELGIDPEVIQKELARTDRSVRGRMEILHGPDGIAAIVDYSHVPDALQNVLETINEFKTNRVITVVGCGGDRDRTKRPVMGRIAGQYSDYVILTSDNPRTEDPYAILAEIEPGTKETGCPYEVVEDRREAISRAIKQAQFGDIVLVAGKGHEDYQIIGRTKHHLDDVEEVRKAFEERKQ